MVWIEITFEPHPGFGALVSGGGVFLPHSRGKIRFDPDSGRIHVASQEAQLEPLVVSINDGWAVGGMLDGAFVIRGRRESRAELLSWLNGCTYVMPTILTALFSEPVVVRRIRGTVGDEPFSWTFHRGASVRYEVTTQEAQEDKFLRAWNLLQVISRPESVRLTAALQYFEVACRLARVGATAWEFESEVIVNLSKVLQALFASPSRDSVRAGLRELGFIDEVIDRDYIPIMLLRDKVDAAHISLRLLSSERLETLHEYTQGAEGSIRILIEKYSARLRAKTSALRSTNRLWERSMTTSS